MKTHGNRARAPHHHRNHLAFSVALAALTASTPALAQQTAAPENFVDRILVIGSKEDAATIAGSATVLDAADLEQFEYGDIHRILRMVPGVNIQEEDGYGLRPNIGLRGSSVDRSEKITLMEDGVLIAPAPYAAPAAYYFPTAGRMSAVEVRKGSAAVKFGPRSVGGAINLVSTPVPEDFGGQLDARFGSDTFYQVHGHAGATVEGDAGKLGVLLETYQSGSDGFKNLDGGGDTGFEIEDYMAKFRIGTRDDAAVPQTLEIKLGLTDQQSDETYLGLTDADFRDTPFRRYAASQNDRFDSEHKQIQATHHADFGSFDLTTVGYYNKFARDWFKFDQYINTLGQSMSPRNVVADPTAFAADLAIFRGEADSADDAIQLRHNNRTYYSWGVQMIGGVEFTTGKAAHELELSVRYHEDQEDRLQNDENFAMRNGTLVLTSVDPIGSNANRVADAKALAFAAEDRIRWGGWTFTPGVRVEIIDLVRSDFSTGDPARANGPTRIRKNEVTAFVPGLGVTYQVQEGLLLLAGVSRGFSPPTPGSEDQKEEDSINYEFGARYDGGRAFIEAIGFFNDYNNLLGTCTASSGLNDCDIGDVFNGGAVNIMGVELSGGLDFGLGNGIRVPLRFNYTYTDTKFQSTFDSDFFGDVVKGDEVPLVPNHQGLISAGLDAEKWGTTLSMNFVSPMRNVAGAGTIPVADKIESHVVFDLSAFYMLTEKVKLFGSVENLFDTTYAVARRPYGLRPGKPQSFIGGLSVRF